MPTLPRCIIVKWHAMVSTENVYNVTSLSTALYDVFLLETSAVDFF